MQNPKEENQDDLEGIEPVAKTRDSTKARQKIDRSYYAIRDQVISDMLLSCPEMSIQEVADITGYERVVVGAITKKLALRKMVKERNAEIKREILDNKIPILKEIASLSLTSLRDYLAEIVANPIVRDQRIQTIADAKSLSSIMKDLNEVLRLELGQATSIEKKDVQLSIDQTKQIFIELSQNDPVFDYPQLTDGRSKTIDLTVEADPAPCRNDEDDLLIHEVQGGDSTPRTDKSS